MNSYQIRVGPKSNDWCQLERTRRFGQSTDTGRKTQVFCV